jgi:DNA-binding GntR family transcriptional regulator
MTDKKKPAKGKAKPAKRAEAEQSAVSVVDMAVDRIRQKIMRGQFVPGQRLIEPDLAEQINVSRTALREAFRRLAAEGLLELALYKGATVRMLKKDDVAEVFMIRELLEGLVARLATVAINKNPKLKKALLENRDAMRKSVKALDAGDAYTMANTQFHQLLLDAIESPQLERMVSQLQMPLYRMIYARLLAEPARLKSLSDHERIIEAILDNDPQRAEREMQAHVHNSGELLLSLSDDYFG